MGPLGVTSRDKNAWSNFHLVIEEKQVDFLCLGTKSQFLLHSFKVMIRVCEEICTIKIFASVGVETVIISDLDYLETVSEPLTVHINGGRAIAWAQFSALALGTSTLTTGTVTLLAVSGSSSSAFSSVQVTSAASGSETFSSATATSTVAVF